jgi:hypothetical protein
MTLNSAEVREGSGLSCCVALLNPFHQGQTCLNLSFSSNAIVVVSLESSSTFLELLEKPAGNPKKQKYNEFFKFSAAPLLAVHGKCRNHCVYEKCLLKSSVCLAGSIQAQPLCFLRAEPFGGHGQRTSHIVILPPTCVALP